MESEINFIQLRKIIENALEEDLSGGDITTVSTVKSDLQITGRLIAKENGVICGLLVFKEVFACLNKSIEVETYKQEGDAIEKDCLIATIQGNARSILSGERVALNLLQRMSGIATSTRHAVDRVKGTGVRITDTRKTTPGLRILEKYAVRAGGGINHRFNLSDGILIKDNHIQAAGGIKPAIERARSYAPHTLKIEVEVENSLQIAEALHANADIIMLDNMDTPAIRDAVRQINNQAMIEISGNMNTRDLEELATTGIHLISIGALTHSARALDISLRLDNEHTPIPGII